MANNYPTIRPTLSHNYAGMGVLPPDVTFTRASQSGGYYDGRTVSKAEENLFLQSQTFETTWTNIAGTATVTADTAAAPDGTITADTVAETAGTGGFGRQQARTLLANTVYTISCHFKDVNVRYVGLNVYGNSNNYCYAEFDLTSAVLNRSAALGTGWSIISTSITLSTNGYYRVTLTLNTGTDVSIPRSRLFISDGSAAVTNDGVPSYTGTTKSAYFWGAQLEQRSTATAYTPTTTAPITNYIPRMLFAAANVPVFDHNPVTGEALGLSVWEARTNLLTYSQEFNDASWGKNAVTVTANQIIAPDGTLTAYKLISTAVSGFHNISKLSGTRVASAAYTFSFFAKAGEIGFCAPNFSSALTGTSLSAVINLSTGVATSVSAGLTVRTSIVGNGFYRIAITATGDANTTSFGANINATNAAGTLSHTGDGYSGIYIWGAQLEAGAFATPYIPTVASTVARSADVPVMTGVNFSRWFNAGAGTLVAEYTNVGAATSVASANDGTNNNRVTLLSRPSTASSSDEFAVIVSGAATQASLNSISYTTQGKNAISYKANDIAGTMNGAAVRTDTTAIIPVVDRLSFGAASTTVGSVYIRSLAYYPIDLSDANIVAVTA